MAIAFTNLGASANPDLNDSADSSVYTNTAWTPPSSGLICVFVETRRTLSVPAAPAVSGNGLTWTQIASGLHHADARRLTLFAANASGSSSGATTFDFSTATQLNCQALFLLSSGVDLTGGVAAAFAQSTTATGTSSSASVVGAAPADSSNRPMACFSHVANEATTPRTNWTEADDLAITAPNTGTETQYRSDAFESTASATFATADDWGALFAELKVAGGAVAAPRYSASCSLLGYGM